MLKIPRKLLRATILLPQLFEVWDKSVIGQMLFKKKKNDLQLVDLNNKGKIICNNLLKRGDLLCDKMPNHREILPHYNQSLIDIYLGSIRSMQPREILIQYKGEVEGWYRNSMLSPRKDYLFMGFIDVTDEETRLYTDPVTRLYNLAYLGWLNRCFFSAVIMDVDNFSRVQSLVSHDFSNKIILRITECINTSFSRYKTIIMKGDKRDQFIILLDEKVSIFELLYLSKTLLESANRIRVGNLHLNTSFGLSHGALRTPSSVLMDRAKLALEQAKQDKTTADPASKIKVWEQQMSARRERQSLISEELKHAITRKELDLVFQGVFRLDPFEVVGCEALLRWSSKRLGFVSPGEFIPIAEYDSLIVDLGRWVLQEVFWKLEALSPDFWISVNLSPTEIELNQTIDWIQSVFSPNDQLFNKLSIEVTERKLAHNTRNFSRNLRHLRNLGVGLKLDDFGTGSAGLLQLIQLPLKYVKIDKSLLPESDRDTRLISVLQSLQQLFQNIGIDVIVEGVETLEQLNIIREVGFSYAQGYFLNRPCSWDEFLNMINKQE